ncbi:protein DEK, putative [Entamoeba dispar SAW760]|uniref:Protein DEK, putative n=1 Tax=Entamoeba dispar (strain ATCC PRA-260 / SAW760) TaxID=370354 RepID=B0EMZ6_ENTDS|nr:protein DEK, putative [Entamoeba dispar SAW760]EDR24120.1 protein DEK, putative [Entamoeba dispar SAW760]|eukprot:EDR24120.1 protein DEK, putative [Entamoeba dispar SAW760]
MSTLAERRKQSPREKKTITRYKNSSYDKETIEGEGKALKEIPEIASTMKGIKKASDIAHLIHRVLFGTPGSVEERKKDIMSFKGLKGNTEIETTELLEKKKQYLEKQKFVDLIEICRLFCLGGASKEKTKEKYAEEIVEFLKKPGDVKIVVTERDKVANIEEELEEEEDKKKPIKKQIKKEEKEKKLAKKDDKKPLKKETTKKEIKKSSSKTEKEPKKPKGTKIEKKITTPKKEAKTKGKK